MVSGPETARLLMEYDENHSLKRKNTDHHHEQIPSVQKTFITHVKNVTDIIEELGNPFVDTSSDLFALDSKQIMPNSVVDAIKSAEDIGKAQYHTFLEERLYNNTADFNDTISKNKLSLLCSDTQKKTAKHTSNLSNLNDDISLFSRMYVSCQARGSDMDTFFKHENHAWPPSLASNGIMHQTKKSDLMECLESLAPQPDYIPDVDVDIIDGAALVHILDPKKSHPPVETFFDYSRIVFLPYIERLLQKVVRVDVVWDVYKEDSLKTQTRQNRGYGSRLRVESNTKVPANWNSFLRCDENKTSLFQYLANALQEFHPPPQKQVISTYGQKALSAPPMSDTSPLASTQDTRLLFHASHAYHSGFKKLMIHVTDTDVMVIAMSSVLHGCEIWTTFGHGAKKRYIPCHLISQVLGSDVAWGLLLLHGFTGCDTVSAFRGIGKKTAWTVWRSMPHLIPLFARLSRAPCEVSSTDMEQIERFVVLLYQRTSALNQVNEARLHLFTQNRKMDYIPPTFHALEQHLKRAVYQAGHIWGQCLVANPELPSPSLWGWNKANNDNTCTPCWSTLPEAAKACQELLKCGCKKACSKRFRCAKANLQCTNLCYCSGQCARD